VSDVRFFERLQFHGLFIKMFLVMVASIVAVSVLITWTTIRMSERLFIKTFSITNTKVIDQVQSGLASFNDAIVTASNNMLQSGTIKQFLTEGNSDSLTMNKAYYNMSNQVEQMTSNLNAYEVAVVLNGLNGRTFATDRAIWPFEERSLKQHPIAISAQQQPKRLLYHFYRESAGARPVIIASKALLQRTTGELYGSMFFAMRESEFKRFYASYTSVGNDVVILNRDGVIVSSNRGDLLGNREPDLLAEAQAIESKGLNYRNARVMGQDSLVISQYLSGYDLYLVNLIDKRYALSQLIDTRAIVLICIGIVCGALIIVFLISRRLTKSLTRLVKQISTISKYDFDHYVTVSGSYETKQLALAFNDMMDELHEYVEELLLTQKKQRNAELAALQRQINPHFLYNTLASVKIMVQQGNKDKAAETINALISLLQNAIGNVSETVSIEQELVNLKNYVFINQVRYGGRIKVSYFIAPDCMQAEVPKLIIQPFIENAFFHGFNRKPEGYIYVMAQRDGDVLVCEVADNGDGFVQGSDGSERGLPRAKGERKLFTGIGLSNVHDRIKLLYGEHYGVTIDSQLGEGTRVKIRLPFQAASEEAHADGNANENTRI
jgi:two-component system, sensor histidine kinase YesM